MVLASFYGPGDRHWRKTGLDPNQLTYFYGRPDRKWVGIEPVEPIHQIIRSAERSLFLSAPRCDGYQS